MQKKTRVWWYLLLGASSKILLLAHWHYVRYGKKLSKGKNGERGPTRRNDFAATLERREGFVLRINSEFRTTERGSELRGKLVEMGIKMTLDVGKTDRQVPPVVNLTKVREPQTQGGAHHFHQVSKSQK